MIYLLENLAKPRDLGTDIPFMNSARLDYCTVTGETVKSYPKQNGEDRTLYIGPKHARVSAEMGEVFVEDLGSLIGTFIDGAKIGEDLSEIHPDWRERRYSENEEKIKKMNRGKVKVELGCIIQIGKEVFEDKAPAYRLTRLPVAEPIERNKFNYGDIIKVKPDIETEVNYLRIGRNRPVHRRDPGVVTEVADGYYRVKFSDGLVSEFTKDQLLLVPRNQTTKKP